MEIIAHFVTSSTPGTPAGAPCTPGGTPGTPAGTPGTPAQRPEPHDNIIFI